MSEIRCKHGWLMPASQCPDCAEIFRLEAEIDRLKKEVNDLIVSCEGWKREWRLISAAETMAEKEIDRLKEENASLLKKLERSNDAWLTAKEEIRRLKVELTDMARNTVPI